MFVQSHTAVTMLSAVPAVESELPITNPKMAASRDHINMLAHSQRVVIQGQVLPNNGLQAQLDGMDRLVQEQKVICWKIHTEWGPNNTWGNAPDGYWLDDASAGIPLIEKARQTGVKTFCCHKGLPAPLFNADHCSPRDLGPVAKMYPDNNWVAYHSSYGFGGSVFGATEGAYQDASMTGIDALITVMKGSGIAPNQNIHAEVGGVWNQIMTNPTVAAHVIGKLLLYVGENNLLWGSDAIWTSKPQPYVDAFWNFDITPQFQMQYGSQLCGACHDIVNTAGVALERTYAEWRGSGFGEHGAPLQTCAQCHMDGYAGRTTPQAPERTLHRHLWPGVDIAIEKKFPGVEAQTAAIACKLANAISLALAPVQGAAFDAFEVTLTNTRVGHAWPSGVTQDRRAWVELIAYDADDNVIFQRGVVATGEVVGAAEPELEVLRDRLYDENANPVHMFWRAAPSDAHPRGYESDLLAPPTLDASPTARIFRYNLPAPASRVTARLLIQSIGLDVLDDFEGVELPISQRLLNNGYQDSQLRSHIPTIAVPGTERELRAGVDGQVKAVPAAPATTSDTCRNQDYVSLLGAD